MDRKLVRLMPACVLGCSLIATAWSDNSGSALRLRESIDVFFAFQSGLKNTLRRKNLRGWLTPLTAPESGVKTAYRFFSDQSLPDSGSNENVVLPAAIHFQRANWRTFLTRRFLFELEWAHQHYDFRWLSRMDDDVFVCVSNFISLLRDLPANGPQLVFANLHAKQERLAPECKQSSLDSRGRKLQPMTCWPKFAHFDECWMLMSSEVVWSTLAKVESAVACEPGDTELPMDLMHRYYSGGDVVSYKCDEKGMEIDEFGHEVDEEDDEDEDEGGDEEEDDDEDAPQDDDGDTDGHVTAGGESKQDTNGQDQFSDADEDVKAGGESKHDAEKQHEVTDPDEDVKAGTERADANEDQDEEGDGPSQAEAQDEGGAKHCSSRPWLPDGTLGMNIGTFPDAYPFQNEPEWGRSLWIQI